MKECLFKKLLYIFLIWLLFFQESCTTLKPEAIGPVRIETPLGLCHAGQTKTDREYQLLDDLGCEWLRVDYHWNTIERTQGNFDFQSTDQFTQAALQHNKKILAVLCYDAAWMHDDKKKQPYISPEYYDAFTRYVTATVTRYKDQVSAFEIWNEPNLKIRFWGGKDNEFFDLFKRTVNAIKSIDSTIIVTTPGICRGSDKYLQKMFEAGAMEHVDVISFHPYAITLPGYLKQIEQMQETAQSFGFEGEYWISEMGYPSGGLYPTRVSEDKLPAKTVKTLVYGLAKNIRLITWYHLFDEEKRKKSDSEDFFGLVIRDKEYTYKKGAYAFRAIARNISHSYLMNPEVKCNISGLQYYNFRQDNGNCLLVLWSENGHRKLNLSVPSGECLQWDISGPDIKTLSGSSMCIEIGKEPVVLTFSNKEKLHENIIIKDIK
jgi:polysaccharide biosynthesis protein PslG